MHFKENESVKDSLGIIEKHFNQVSKRDITQEMFLGFTRDTPNFVINRGFVSQIKSDFTSVVTAYETIKEKFNETSSNSEILDIAESFTRGYFTLDDTGGVIDKRLVNGQMSMYKEWVDFAKSNGITSQENFDEFKQVLTDCSVFFKKASLTVKDLSDTIKEIRDNKRNGPYVRALIQDFIEVFNDKVVSQNDFFMNINKNVSRYENVLYKMTIDIETMKENIKKQTPEVMKTMANKFCDSQIDTDNDISNFLKSKDFDHLITTRVQLKGQSRPDSILFLDGSYAYVDNGQYRHTLSEYDYFDSRKELHESAIGHLSRKKPKVATFFKRFIEDSESAVDIIPVLDTYQQYGDVVARSGINVLQMTDKSMEAVDDSINEVVLEHKLNQYVNSILSNKYQHLLTPEARDMLKIIYEAGVNKQSLQNYVGKKIAALKTPEEFLEYVTKVKDHFSGFTHNALSTKLEGNGIKPCYDKDGIVIFHVENFETSKKLGSPSWCISRTSNYFEDYTDNGARQYFMYDFNEKETSNNSMIGFTIKKDGSVLASHLKNDDDFKFLTNYSALHLEVLKNDFNVFKLNDEYSKVMKEKYNLGDYKEKPKKTGLKI
jgi:hypothetical protein